jgi:hypothetical protein
MHAAIYGSATGALDSAREEPDPECSNRSTQLASGTELQDGANKTRQLELSLSRTYDSALAILRAYKLTGNFPTELEIVLRDLGVLDEVTYETKEPRFPLSDIRHVVFWANANVHAERFWEITRLIDSRIGSSGMQPWWSSWFR